MSRVASIENKKEKKIDLNHDLKRRFSCSSFACFLKGGCVREKGGGRRAYVVCVHMSEKKKKKESIAASHAFFSREVMCVCVCGVCE